MTKHLAAIRCLPQLAASDPTVVGQRAVRLGRLHALGLPVPETFCVTTAAYHDYLAAHALDRWFEDELRRLPADDRVTGQAFADAVRDRFDACPMHQEVARELRSACTFLASQVPVSPGVRRRTGVLAVPPIAVTLRPSAVDEDGQHVPHAGEFQACLNVRGDAAIERAVRAHWAALFSEAAMAHRAGPDAAIDSGGVIVQRFVDADRTALVYSADPTSGDRRRIAIRAGWGPNSALDDELIGHDTFVIARSHQTVLQRQIADKQAMVVPLPDGDVDQAPVPMELTRIACLSNEEALELAALTVQIENAFGHGVVVECAFEGVALLVLDCRPL